MDLQNAPHAQTTLEACLDEIDQLVSMLDRYPPALLAMALRLHLEALLQAQLEAGTCTREEVREFVTELLEGSLEAVDAET